jgi:hypothetical protein
MWLPYPHYRISIYAIYTLLVVVVGRTGGMVETVLAPAGATAAARLVRRDVGVGKVRCVTRDLKGPRVSRVAVLNKFLFIASSSDRNVAFNVRKLCFDEVSGDDLYHRDILLVFIRSKRRT